MVTKFFSHITDAEKAEAVEKIIQHASPRRDFFVMLVLSVAMAAIGVVLDSVVVLIGSMLIAPMLFPILSLSLGIIMADDKLITGPVYTIVKSLAYSLGAGFIIGLFFFHQTLDTLNIVAAAQPSLLYGAVAIVAGLAAAYALARPQLNDTLPGVAISVSLVPPLAVAGIALSKFNWTVFTDSFLLFLVNVIGIIFSALLVFSLMKIATKRHIADETVKEEEENLKKEGIVK